MEKKLELLEKIRRLSVQGIGGEKFNANKKLDELMNKYSISYESLGKKEKRMRYFICRNKYEKMLLIQIYYAMTNDKNFHDLKTNKKIGLDLSDTEFIELSIKYSVYKIDMEKEFELLYKAFIYANDIIPHDNGETTTYETDELKKIIERTISIEKSKIYKQLK